MKKLPCDKKVVLFGELMMRLSTKRHERIVQAREFDVIYSGAEANLGVALAGIRGRQLHGLRAFPTTPWARPA